jgi:hypothetical protein
MTCAAVVGQMSHGGTEALSCTLARQPHHDRAASMQQQVDLCTAAGTFARTGAKQVSHGGTEARRPCLALCRVTRLLKRIGVGAVCSSLLFSSLLFSSLCLAHPIGSRASGVRIPLTSVPPCLRERPLRERLLKRVSRTTHARGVSDFVVTSAPLRETRYQPSPPTRDCVSSSHWRNASGRSIDSPARGSIATRLTRTLIAGSAARANDHCSV